ncbi:protein PROCA1 [Malaclemys terrapin pileata]|uniref:protein PROCA1 n=1 Tax=Malaclemys terrapin pileata TaxID=2991368 RepID=UPI0023A8656C|nr:protein PROCA1 [Malaclemys terrapin pileata]
MRAVALRLLCLLAAARGSESPGQPGPAGGPVRSPDSGRRQPLGATWAPGPGQGPPEPAGGAARRRTKRGFTYPGTLWCGAGNNADSYGQLGEHRETDECCREHDHCQHVIHPFTAKYGYRNLRWHTISHCACDLRLKVCLRQVNDTASRVVGQAFFNVIQVPCFEFTYKEQCVEPYLYIWCKKYNTVAIAVPRKPVLYEFGGELIDEVAAGSDRAPSSPAPQPGTPPPRESTGRWALPPTKHPPPGQLVTGAMDSFQKSAPTGPKRESPAKTQRKGKGKKRGRKTKKGKGLKKKKVHPKAEVLGLPTPTADTASLLPKHLVLDFGRKEDVFNAILNDAPVGEETLTPRGAAQAESSDRGQLKARPLPTLQPTCPAASKRKRRRERNGRKRPRKEAESLPRPG